MHACASSHKHTGIINANAAMVIYMQESLLPFYLALTHHISDSRPSNYSPTEFPCSLQHNSREPFSTQDDCILPAVTCMSNEVR